MKSSTHLCDCGKEITQPYMPTCYDCWSSEVDELFGPEPEISVSGCMPLFIPVVAVLLWVGCHSM